MKKLVSLILTVCFVLIPAANIICPASILSEEKPYTLLNLYSVSDFASELESEDVDITDENAYEICVLLELKNTSATDDSYFDARNIIVGDNDVDEALREHRTRVKEHYLAYNESIASTLNLNEYEYYVSYYSPYIEIIFDDLAEYERCESELLNSIVNPDFVVSASNYALVDATNYEATVDSSSYSTNYPLSDAFEDIGVSNSLYTGNGVKVGIIDQGVPNTINLKSGKYTRITSVENEHSTVIASIIGGTSGIAENVHFYCIGGESLVDSVNSMIDTCNVNIINLSLGYLTVGYYTRFDAYIDNTVSHSGCTFVKSAGNKGSTNAYVTAPGCAMNAITVGSINYSQNVRASSSWNVSNGFLLKPDVVAPGGILANIPNLSDNYEVYSGTSYAAPMVVGTIALLMEEFSILKTNPALVKSVLHLGAEPLPSQTNYFDQQAGFGLINYQNMRNCLLNSNYSNFTISTNTRADDIVLSEYISVPYLDTLKINANTIVNSSVTEPGTTSATPSYTDYLILIYDTAADAYVECSLVDSSVDYLVFTNTNPNNTSYIIDVIAAENSDSIATEYGSLAYEIVEHDHSFTDRYVWQSYLQHKCYCECGRYSTASHVVLQGDFPAPGDYAICLRCRGQASMGTLQSIPAHLPHTDNGSYILTNGTIVLAEEDIEAYMAGTLEFHYGEKE